jgi:hypothetical protein
MFCAKSPERAGNADRGQIFRNRTIDFSLTNTPGLVEFGRFDNTGGMFTVAPGFNAVLIQDKLELGAVCETPIWSQRNFNFNSLLVKMILRF